MKVLTVGRASSNDVVINDKTVSSQHLQLVIHNPSHISIVNLSKNSITLVNDMKIQGEHRLNPKDVVKVGNVVLNWQNYVAPQTSQYNNPQGGNKQKVSSNLNINDYKHPKEKAYFAVLIFVSALLWLFVLSLISYYKLVLVLYVIIPVVILLVLIFAITESFFKAILFGNSIYISRNQYPEVNKILQEQSNRLGITPPKMFIYNGNGVVNAMAIKFLYKKYIILMADLVDVMIKNNDLGELSMIIGHELGHHFAGHTSILKSMFLFPGKILPFAGKAYLRACELTADRVGYILVGNVKVAQNALISIASGSRQLSKNNNVEAFINQEQLVPGLMGFIHKVFSSHPRMTKRVLELDKFYNNYHR